MKLSLREDYALRALILLSENYGRGILPVQMIAGPQNIPKRFLEQILNDLKAGGFVESRRGIAGGYQLARLPEQITLAELFAHFGGALMASPAEGEDSAGAGKRSDPISKAIYGTIQEVQTEVEKMLRGMTLANLSHRAQEWRNAATVDYMI